MLENRKTVLIALGIIIGIIMGLYCKISIVLFYGIIYIIKILSEKNKRKTRFKLISFKRYLRYVKIIFTKSVINIIIISSIISNSVILYQNNKYENAYKNLTDEEIICRCTVISDGEEKENRKIYKIKVINIQNASRLTKNTKLYLTIRKDINENLKIRSRNNSKRKIFKT